MAIADLHIDQANVESVFDVVAQNLLSCSNTRFALACSIDGIPLKHLTHIVRRFRGASCSPTELLIDKDSITNIKDISKF